MFVAHVKSGQWVALYGPNRNLLGTIKLSPQRNGHMGLVLDFPQDVRFDTKYQKHDRPPVVKTPELFGDYDPPDYDVPVDADNY